MKKLIKRGKAQAAAKRDAEAKAKKAVIPQLTSAGLAPGYTTLTATTGNETSGNRSVPRRESPMAPRTISATVNMTVKTGRLMDVSASHIQFCPLGKVLLAGHDEHLAALEDLDTRPDGAHHIHIKLLRAGRYKPGVVRLVMELKSKVAPQVFEVKPVGEYGHRLVLDVYPLTPVDPARSAIRRCPGRAGRSHTEGA